MARDIRATQKPLRVKSFDFSASLHLTNALKQSNTHLQLLNLLESRLDEENHKLNLLDFDVSFSRDSVAATQTN